MGERGEMTDLMNLEDDPEIIFFYDYYNYFYILI